LEAEKWKEFAAERSIEFVQEGMRVGLGSGTTVQKIIIALSRKRVRAKFVPASRVTEELAKRLGLEVVSLEECPDLDLVLDGADQVDPDFNALKGKGGALTREKILCHAAEKVIFVVDRTKLVRVLEGAVPVEVLSFGFPLVKRKLEELGGKPRLREVSGSPFITDNGNFILDTDFGRIREPERMERDIKRIPGVVENGIFPRAPDELVVGYEGGAVEVRSRKRFVSLLRSFSLKGKGKRLPG
jgi:ribose 5-phosphate isomerase A